MPAAGRAACIVVLFLRPEHREPVAMASPMLAFCAPIACAALASACSRSPDDPWRRETELATRQQSEADVVIHVDLDKFDARRVEKGFYVPTAQPRDLTIAGLAEWVRLTGVPTASVVVVLSKRLGVDRAARECRMDELESALAGAGFRHIVFHGASATGIPILRERRG